MAHTAISVIIPCYKQAEYLPEALDSLMAQTFGEWKPSSSTTDRPTTPKRWLSPMPPENPASNTFRSKTEAWPGPATGASTWPKANISCRSMPTTPSPPPTSKRPKPLSTKTPLSKSFYCRARFFGDKSGPWKVGYKDFKSLLAVNAIFVSALFRKADAKAIGGFDEAMTFGHEDWDFFIRLLDGENRVYQIPKYSSTTASKTCRETPKR